MNNTNILKKVSDHSVHFLSGGTCPKESKQKSKKSPGKSTMNEPQTVTGLDKVLNMHQMPIKGEYPTTSEYLMMDEFRQSLVNSTGKRGRGRPKVDFLHKPIKIDHPGKSTMTEPPTVAGMDQVLNVHQMPIKVEYPTTSEYLMMDEFRQSLANSTGKRGRGRPKIDFIHKPIKIEPDAKVEKRRIGRRRGRPSKSKLYDSGQLVCSLCDYKAQDFYDLEGHMKSHSDQHMYECPYCNSSFSQKGNLITHIRTHTNDKPFKCLICDFAASQKVNLQVHIRVHTKEKPYKCSACDFSAAQKCNLMAHVVRRHSHIEVVKSMDNYDVHSGNHDSQLKYYRCNMCMFSCRLKKEILEHIKTQHPYSVC